MRFPARKIKEPTWLKWFAWYPVCTELADGTSATVWLETIERKQTQGYGGPSWRYRELYNG